MPSGNKVKDNYLKSVLYFSLKLPFSKMLFNLDLVGLNQRGLDCGLTEDDFFFFYIFFIYTILH